MNHEELNSSQYCMTMIPTHKGWVIPNLETDEVYSLHFYGGKAMVQHDNNGAMDFIVDGLMPSGDKVLHFEQMEDALLYIQCRINPTHPTYGSDYGDQMEELADRKAA